MKILCDFHISFVTNNSLSRSWNFISFLLENNSISISQASFGILASWMYFNTSSLTVVFKANITLPTFIFHFFSVTYIFDFHITFQLGVSVWSNWIEWKIELKLCKKNKVWRWNLKFELNLGTKIEIWLFYVI